jgi:hypothetical protein
MGAFLEPIAGVFAPDVLTANDMILLVLAFGPTPAFILIALIGFPSVSVYSATFYYGSYFLNTRMDLFLGGLYSPVSLKLKDTVFVFVLCF